MTFDQLVEELHALVQGNLAMNRRIRLLNVGTANPREHHWRFRTSLGEIVTITIEKEP